LSRSQESALSVERLVVKTRSRLRRTFQHTCRGGLLKQQSTMQRIALAALDLNFAASSTMGRVELPIASRSVSCASVLGAGERNDDHIIQRRTRERPV
jgi:hypothetical protein